MKHGWFFLACLVATTASAATWHKIGTDGKSHLFVDTDTVERRGSNVTASTRIQYTPPKHVGRHRVSEERARVILHCATFSVRQLSNTGFDGQKAVPIPYLNEGVQPILPGSVGEAYFWHLCRSSR